MSPSWANNTDEIMRFFLGDPLPLKIGTLDEYDLYHLQIDPNQVFILTPDEYNWLLENPKFDQVEVLDRLELPDGRTGFYFLSVEYSKEAGQIFEIELQERRQPEVSEVEVLGQLTTTTYSRLDLGTIAHIFDGNELTPMRTLEANPLEITIAFSEPVELQKLTALVGSPATRLSVSMELADGVETPFFTKEIASSDNIRPFSVEFGSVYRIRQLTVWIESINEEEPTHVHLWELVLE